MTTPLPPGQTRILEFFADAEDEGRQPSRAEVAEALGYAFPSAVSKHVDALVRKGLLAADRDKKRNVRLTEAGWSALDRLPAAAARERESQGLPVIGAIAAGTPITADSNVARHLRGLAFAPNRIALQVRGDSMVGDGILDGDFAVIEARDAFPEDRIAAGRIYAVVVDGEATLKHVRRAGDALELISSNPKYPPRRITSEHLAGGHCRILGPLSSIYRELT